MVNPPATASAPNSRLRPDSLALSVFILLAVGVVQRTIGFGRGVLYCRWLSPEELGHWEMAFSFLMLASPLVVLGLPGSFGRYLERYRQRGQLRMFLLRSASWTAILVVLAVVLLATLAPQFSYFLFGQSKQVTLTRLVAACLVAVVLHHFLEALFAALRKFRIVSTMHFCQSILFAALSLILLWRFGSAAECIIIGYGLACLISAAAALVWTHRDLAELTPRHEPVSHLDFWPPLLRFAVWVWVINVLCHLYGVVDRYMLVHYSGLDNARALALVGQYHASRIIPLLFISVSDLVAGAVMPYLSHDWEAGRKTRVSDRTNLVLKLTAFGMFAVGVVVLWFAPLLFHVAFEGRYDGGLRVLPWTLTYCVWYSLLIVAQNYIWCAERARLGAIPLAIGLVVNTALNLILIPSWGLLGTVVATTASGGVALGTLYWINRQAGMRLDPGMIWLSMIPIALSGGAVLATTTLIGLGVFLAFSRTLVSQQERDLLNEVLRHQSKSIRDILDRRYRCEVTQPSR
jgi:O-antigen/teichoic acid export membrane protein